MDIRILIFSTLLVICPIIQAASLSSSRLAPIIVHSAAPATAFSEAATLSLWIAIKTRDINRLRSMLILRANPDALNPIDNDGETPLSYLISNPYHFKRELFLDFVTALINNGSNPALPNRYGDLPIHRVPLININTQNDWGLDLSKILLSVYPEQQINAKDTRGDTTLHHSISEPEIFKYLLKMGADPFLEYRYFKENTYNYALSLKYIYEKYENRESLNRIDRCIEILELSDQCAAQRVIKMQKVPGLQACMPEILILISSFLQAACKVKKSVNKS